MSGSKIFWGMAFNYGWITIDQLKEVVKTETRPRGEITPEEFKEITKEDFIKLEKNVEIASDINPISGESNKAPTTL